MVARAVLLAAAGWILSGCAPDAGDASAASGPESQSPGATSAGVQVSAAGLDFGQVLVGAASAASVTVTNGRDQELAIAAIAIAGDPEGVFTVTSWQNAIVLAPRAAIVVQVAYRPAAVQNDQGRLVIETDDAEYASLEVALTGSGVPLPAPEVDLAAPALDFGEVLVGDSRSLEMTVRNRGTAPLTVAGLELAPGTHQDFEVVPPPPFAAVAPGAQLSFTVRYLPAAPGDATGTLVITTDDADEPVIDVALSGRGVVAPAPEIEVAPLALDFGAAFRGSRTTLAVEVRNTGSAPLQLADLAFGPATGGEFALAASAGPATVAPGAGLQISVTYAPADDLADSGTLEIASDDADEGLIVVSLAGTGVLVPLPEVAVSPAALDFGEVLPGSSRSLALTVHNGGTAPLELSGVSLGSGTSAAFQITSAPAGGQLAPGASLAAEVTYTPAGTGADSGTLEVRSNDPDEAVLTVSLAGRGAALPAPEIDLSGVSLAFGDVLTGEASVLQVVVANTGSAPLELGTPALGAGSSPDFALTAPPAVSSLAPGEQVVLEVTYLPAGEGTDTGTLEIPSSDADEPTSIVSLSGTGVAAPPDLHSLTLAWQAPSANEDGTPLFDLAGYRLYGGMAPDSLSLLVDVGAATAFTVDSLPAGTYLFAVTAYDLSGNESAFSESIEVTVPYAIQLASP